jgi:hypothetical protein
MPTYNPLMPVLRYLYALALVLWLGGVVVAGAVVAPATFGVLEWWNATDGRVLAGLVFGEVLRRLHVGAYVAGAVMIVALTLHRLLGPRPAGYGLRVTIASTMLALTIVSGAVVSPRVTAIQREVSGPVAALSPDDPRRVAFNRWHGLSNVLLSAVVVGGLVLLVWEARE